MQRYADRSPPRPMATLPQTRTWERTHAWDGTPENGTYGLLVATSSDVNRQRFAKFVTRVLADARDRKMTDEDIVEVTGVGSSTFHRWQGGDFRRMPELEKVKAFCEGLGVPVRAAMLALGVEEGRDETEPDPAVDPDIRRILRALADPNVSDEDKLVIREMLKMAAARVRSPKPSGSLTET